MSCWPKLIASPLLLDIADRRDGRRWHGDTPNARCRSQHRSRSKALGDDDALHLVYFSDVNNQIEHKRLSTDTTWVDVSAAGWNQNVDGAIVSSFVDEAASNAALETDATYYFPGVVVDRNRLPDRVYSLFKMGTNAPLEGIYFNDYSDLGSVGIGASWNTARSPWSDGLFGDGSEAYNVELDWQITERVAAAVDDRLDSRGDLHIAFSAGYSGGANTILLCATTAFRDSARESRRRRFGCRHGRRDCRSGRFSTESCAGRASRRVERLHGICRGAGEDSALRARPM